MNLHALATTASDHRDIVMPLIGYIVIFLLLAL